MTESLKDKMLNKKCKKQEIKRSYFVYIVRCKDGSLYTGKANDLSSRIQAHSSGKGAKYTRSRLPVELVYSEMSETNREAAQRECEIKKLTRAEKESLISERSDHKVPKIGPL